MTRLRVTLRVTVLDPPETGEFGLQEGKGNADLVEGSDAGRGARVYENPLQVDLADGKPKWRGPSLQGRPGERFVYLGWRASPMEPWHRRWKLSLETVDAGELRDGATLAATVRVGEKGVRPNCEWKVL
jgi:hypothetical protein